MNRRSYLTVLRNRGFSERRAQLLADLLSFIYVAFVVVFCFAFMASMHYLVVAIFPRALLFTIPTIIVILGSILLAAYTSGAKTTRGCLGLSVAFIVLYAIIAIATTKSAGYAGTYTIPYVLFGLMGTSMLLADFGKISRLFTNIPKWKAQPEMFSADFLRDEFIDFDKRISSVTVFVASVLVIFVASIVFALNTANTMTSWFLLLAVPVLWSATLIIVFTRIILRLKRLYIEGFDVGEGHVIRPVAYTLSLSVILLAIAGFFAADSSVFSYSALTGVFDNIIGYDRERVRTTEDRQIDEMIPPQREDTVPIAESDVPEAAEPVASAGDASEDLRIVFLVIRYVALGLAALLGLGYVVFSLLRIRHAGEEPREILRQSIHRGRDRARLAFIRFVRMWRIFSRNFRDALSRRKHRDRRVKSRASIELQKIRSTDDIDKHIERHTVLRWYMRLTGWGHKNGVDASKTHTAAEYLELISEIRPDLANETHAISTTFDTAFYSPAPVGRERLRTYIRDIKTVMKR